MRHFWYLFDLHPSRMKAIYLSFHFSNSLVKLFCLPLHSCVNDLGLVKIYSTFIDFSLNLAFSFFNLSELGTQIVNGCFCFSISGGKLHFGHFKLLTLGNSINFILLPQYCAITFGLGNKSKNIFTSRCFFIQSFFCSIDFMFKISKFSKKKLSLSSFIVTQSLDIIELGTQSGLRFGKHG